MAYKVVGIFLFSGCVLIGFSYWYSKQNPDFKKSKKSKKRN